MSFTEELWSRQQHLFLFRFFLLVWLFRTVGLLWLFRIVSPFLLPLRKV